MAEKDGVPVDPAIARIAHPDGVETRPSLRSVIYHDLERYERIRDNSGEPQLARDIAAIRINTLHRVLEGSGDTDPAS